MSECKDCRHSIWDYEEYYPCARHYVVADCELDCDNEDGNCEEFDEYLPPLSDGF